MAKQVSVQDQLTQLAAKVDAKAGELARLIEEAAELAPQAFEGQQLSPQNFLTITERMRGELSWLGLRLRTLANPTPTMTEAGAARRVNRARELLATGEEQDAREARRICDELAAHGIDPHAAIQKAAKAEEKPAGQQPDDSGETTTESTTLQGEE